MQLLDTFLLLFHDPVRNGWLIALMFLVAGSIPHHIYTWLLTTRRQIPVLQYNTADNNTSPSDIHKYSLWLRYFIYWWGKPPRGPLEHVWKSLFIPFLITYSAGEVICVVLTAALLASSLASFIL
jgi:hypothetical protein